MADIERFSIAYTDDAIADLRDRLGRTRWPEKETVEDWSQGIPLSYLRELCEYWAGGYDFALAQDRLNRFLYKALSVMHKESDTY